MNMCIYNNIFKYQMLLVYGQYHTQTLKHKEQMEEIKVFQNIN